MVQAITELGETLEVEDEHLHVWVDYCSVPQKCRHSQQSAIETLAIYAGLCTSFLIVAPKCIHLETGKLLSVKSYLSRLWCRLERLAAAVSPRSRMIEVTTNGSLRTLLEVLHNEGLQTLADDSLIVYKGECTCCLREHRDNDGNIIPCDRLRLRDTMLCLYAMVVCYQSDFSHVHEVFQMVQENRSELLPQEFFPADLLELFDDEFVPILQDILEPRKGPSDVTLSSLPNIELLHTFVRRQSQVSQGSPRRTRPSLTGTLT
eukprot:gnl/MRDRNA2_/MRDRNA2_238230_c0_seq1.p1 gnl/MRDRNA2_/MRDRNA2_238230_c0~~gnl/MRDRNA2_/MRDRNA2_238230_c0_seq1.p1  ORF type:complete len:276 (+),score=28.42 gnl/MRDRNA2_/MRDRNA2_238230_c0_seq1:43-828(+)